MTLRVSNLIGFSVGKNPVRIAGLVQWLSASSITGLADGGAVATWPDISGLGNNATQGVGNNQPVYKVNIVNGKPVVRFAQGTGDLTSIGTADYLNLGDRSALTAGEVFIVIKADADPPATGAASGIWTFGNNTGSSNASHYPFTDGTVYDSFGTTARKTTVNPTPSLAGFNVYNVYSASADWQSFINGSSIFSTATNTVQFVSTTLLGQSLSGTFYAHLNGDVAELVLYSRKLTTAERTGVTNYLKRRYAIA
jgi:hypothetical protein